MIIAKDTFEKVRHLIDVGVTYLVVPDGRTPVTEETLTAYLGFGAVAFRYNDDYAVWVVVIPSEHAGWQADRLASGMIAVNRAGSSWVEAEDVAIGCCIAEQERSSR